MAATMVERTCANKRCRCKFQARAADVKRGWGKFCSKSCKAVVQEARTGRHARHIHGGQGRDGNEWLLDEGRYGAHPFSEEAVQG